MVKDPVSAFTHGCGFVLFLYITVLLLHITKQLGRRNRRSAAAFGISMMLMYLASAMYHTFGGDMFRRIDHVGIFAAIAGTYTPICRVALWKSWHGKVVWIGEWVSVVIGVAMKVFFFDVPYVVALMHYIFMGWMILPFVYPMYVKVGWQGVAWLFIGGVFYTAGGMIDFLEVFQVWPGVFGAHEMMHIMVLAGSLSHCIMIWKYIFKLPVIWR